MERVRERVSYSSVSHASHTPVCFTPVCHTPLCAYVCACASFLLGLTALFATCNPRDGNEQIKLSFVDYPSSVVSGSSVLTPVKRDRDEAPPALATSQPRRRRACVDKGCSEDREYRAVPSAILRDGKKVT